MRVTEILMNEHEIIKSMVLKATEQLALAEPMTMDEFYVYYNFFIEYADTFHHKKEEDIYFSWLLTKDKSLKKGAIAKMLYDHDLLRSTLADAKNSIENSNYEKFKICFMQYCEALYNHIYKEDNVLYKIAENLNKDYNDGDMSMLEDFQRIQKEELQVFNKWKDYPIHAIVQKESDAMKSNPGHQGGCCGMC